MKRVLKSLLPLKPKALHHKFRDFLLRPPWNRNRAIWVDVTVLAEHDAATGIQRVTRAIASEIMRNPPKGWNAFLVRFDLNVNQFRYAGRINQMVTGTTQPQPDPLIKVRRGDLYLGLDLTPFHINAMIAEFKILKAKGLRLTHVLYDLLAVRHPEWWVGGVGDAMDNWTKLVTMHSNGVIAISRATLDDYQQWLIEQGLTPPSRMGWFHLGADINKSLPSSGLPANASETLLALQKQASFLMVGTLEPRKGHAQALAAFELLWQEGQAVNLVIVGKPGWGIDAFIEQLRNHPQNGKYLFFLEAISDEYLETVYQYSTVLLAASEGEGFGLPLIEAARNHIPILARDLQVFREIAGNEAQYFSGNDPSDLAAAIKIWLSNRELHDHPPKIHWLNWKQSYEMLIAALGLP